ncbi:MAG: hypothetical protein RMK00_09640, partial [Bacteroidota bacterium]|nr:hypothetical protein [Bacteroidota bacterium]
MVTVGVSGVVQAVIEALQGRLVGAPSGTRQRVRCPFVEHHKHGDEHPSAWLNLKTGWVNCAVCGSYSPQQVLQRLGENVPSSPAPVQQTIDLQAVWQSLPTNPPYALQRGLHPTTCIAYGLRGGDSWHVPAGALAIPHLDERLRVVAIKYRLPAGEQRYGAVKGS